MSNALLSEAHVPDTSYPSRPGRRPRSPWFAFLLRRAASIVGVVASLIVFTFLIVQLVPGDPARNLLGVTASADQVAAVRKQLGLSQPIVQQFGDYVSKLFSGDLGASFVTSQPVTELLQQRLAVTAQLVALALVLVTVIGFSLGMLVAAVTGSARWNWLSSTFTAATSVSGAMPEYIIGTVLIYVFALTLHVLPAQGGVGFTGLILPAVSVAFAPTAVLARLVRNETLAILSREYIAAATSKRLSRRRLYLRHVLPNVVTSTLTLSGLLLVALLGGTLITENVFNIPGLGTEITQSILQSDYPAIQGVILILGLIAVLITLVIDLLLALLDPRTLSGAVQ